jgi:hypothetical protein
MAVIILFGRGEIWDERRWAEGVWFRKKREVLAKKQVFRHEF